MQSGSTIVTVGTERETGITGRRTMTTHAEHTPDRDADGTGRRTRQRRFLSRVLAFVVLGGILFFESVPAAAHEPTAPTPLPEQGLGFGLVVGLTVTLGVLGGALVARRPSISTSRLSTLGVASLLVGLGCWAVIVAVVAGPALVALIVVLGAAVTWRLRHRIVGGHRGCDQVALWAVLLHRFVEGALLATLYASSAAVGIGAAAILTVHSAAETGAVAGLWTRGRVTTDAAPSGTDRESSGTEQSAGSGWLVIAIVQGVFVAGTLGGGFVSGLLTPVVSAIIVALLGGALIATGVATALTTTAVEAPRHGTAV